MPTALTDFTSYDEVRAVIGVSDEELEDNTLALPLYIIKLQMDLEDLSVDLEALYLAAKTSASPSAVEQKLVDVVSVFSAYAVAQHLLTSLPLFAPQRITDGRAETGRVADPFEGVREGVTSTLQLLKQRISKLLELLGQQVAVTTARVYTRTAGLAVDPITNA